jgi:hypothetical protein
MMWPCESDAKSGVCEVKLRRWIRWISPVGSPHMTCINQAAVTALYERNAGQLAEAMSEGLGNAL